MNYRQSSTLYVVLSTAALAGLVTYHFTAVDPEGHFQVISALPVRHQLASPSATLAPPLHPLFMEERDLAFAAGGGEVHRLTQDRIMGWIRDGRVLSEEDRDSLLAFLGQGQPEGMASGEWEERVNEILNLLHSQSGEVPGLATTMLKMAAENTNPILRMYALQHIAMWIPDEPSAESREVMMGYLRKLSLLPDDPLAGSAVLFLSDLERGGSIANRRPEIAAAARKIAADPSLMIPLRKAAIHTIGKFGTQEDAALLESLSDNTPDLADATMPALGKLRKEEAD